MNFNIRSNTKYTLEYNAIINTRSNTLETTNRSKMCCFFI